MACTIKISDSINFAQCFTYFRPLNPGNNNEPAITSANILIQTILNPPFVWNWNRSSTTFVTVIGQQDYKVALPSFGFIEKASWVPACNITQAQVTSNVATYTTATNLGPAFVVGALVTVTGCTSAFFNVIQAPITSVTTNTFSVALTNANFGPEAETGAVGINGSRSEISQVINVLAEGNELGTPSSIAPFLDDNNGNITFRLLPLPDQVYQIKITFQQRIPALVTTLGGLWTPIPDHYSDIYQWGFLSLMASYSGDPRFGQYSQKFVAALLGVAEGLEDEQRNIFQRAWLASLTEMQVTGYKGQQGTQARGL